MRELTPEESWLINYLRDKGRHWTKAKEISVARRQFAGLDVTGWDRRVVASIAEQLDGQVISSHLGYMLDIHAQQEDILLGYHVAMRKAIGTGQRANRMIANARRRGLLIDEATTEKIVKDISTEMAARVPIAAPPAADPPASAPASTPAPKAAPSKPEQYVEQDVNLFTRLY